MHETLWWMREFTKREDDIVYDWTFLKTKRWKGISIENFEEIYQKLIMRNFKVKLEMQKLIKLWNSKEYQDRRSFDSTKGQIIWINNIELMKSRKNKWYPINEIIKKEKNRIKENNHTLEEEDNRIIKSRITIWEIDWSCFVEIWKKEKRRTISYIYEKGEKIRYDSNNTLRMVNKWMNKPNIKKYVEFTKERYSTWNFVNRQYSAINILQEFNMSEEKIIISPQKLKLTVYESCIINRATIRKFNNTDKNKLPDKKFKPITMKWTNQWKRFDDETIKLKPPDKIQDFGLNEDHIHKRKIKLKHKQLNSLLNASQSIILKIQEMMIWKDNLERWLKEKDWEQTNIQKMEINLILINRLKETLINIGKTKNKRKKKQLIDIEKVSEEEELMILEIRKEINEIIGNSLYNDYKIRCAMRIFKLKTNNAGGSAVCSLNQ
jgi:hypothetical protein